MRENILIFNVDDIVVGEISSKKYVCQQIQSGKYRILKNGDIASTKKAKNNGLYIKNIKPCRYYQDTLPDKVTEKELKELQDKLDSKDYEEKHDIRNIYLRGIAGVCRYIEVASSNGLFKKVKYNNRLVNIPVNHNCDVEIFGLDEEVPLIDIVREQTMKPIMTISEISEEVREYELANRIEKEQDEQVKEKTKNKSLLNILFRK
ncbi:MAG: hypothetical protein HFG48_02960 [Bacilli bacterium]|nr:hypothetical protein [Bacilli bacterium]